MAKSAIAKAAKSLSKKYNLSKGERNDMIALVEAPRRLQKLYAASVFGPIFLRALDNAREDDKVLNACESKLVEIIDKQANNPSTALTAALTTSQKSYDDRRKAITAEVKEDFKTAFGEIVSFL